MDNDALLASVMRKLIDDGNRRGYVNAGTDRDPFEHRHWITVDVHQVDITRDERAALDEVWAQ